MHSADADGLRPDVSLGLQRPEAEPLLLLPGSQGQGLPLPSRPDTEPRRVHRGPLRRHPRHWRPAPGHREVLPGRRGGIARGSACGARCGLEVCHGRAHSPRLQRVREGQGPQRPAGRATAGRHAHAPGCSCRSGGSCHWPLGERQDCRGRRRAERACFADRRSASDGDLQAGEPLWGRHLQGGDGSYRGDHPDRRHGPF
mmetsp:Transcript_69416/g.206802  ORF Transcript_69416/g.206802 Transcript_69416/m.206802 type:complete len:200 (-) Transcript_69416:187-786(-)